MLSHRLEFALRPSVVGIANLTPTESARASKAASLIKHHMNQLGGLLCYTLRVKSHVGTGPRWAISSDRAGATAIHSCTPRQPQRTKPAAQTAPFVEV